MSLEYSLKLFFGTSHTLYSVDKVDVLLEMEQWAEWAALVRVACSARFYISGDDIHLIHTVWPASA